MSVTQAAFSDRDAFSAADAAIVAEIGIEELAELLSVDQGELETAVFGLKKPKTNLSGGLLKRLRSRIGMVSQNEVAAKIAKINGDISAVDLQVAALNAKMVSLNAQREGLVQRLSEWEAKKK